MAAGKRRNQHQSYLTSVRVRAGVGHAQLAGLGVAELEVLIRKLVSVDRLATSAITLREVSTLYEKAIISRPGQYKAAAVAPGA
jgi:hypothetical protein